MDGVEVDRGNSLGKKLKIKPYTRCCDLIIILGVDSMTLRMKTQMVALLWSMLMATATPLLTLAAGGPGMCRGPMAHLARPVCCQGLTGTPFTAMTPVATVIPTTPVTGLRAMMMNYSSGIRPTIVSNYVCNIF